ncbi:enoyl-CoA hydratase/isomerase family protein [Arsenicicoccus dermatophilus]|uniref:enoyl-CoA hydratase/isomerase family protein n=1 Tax=Arsenicicoccus dermatophilus TaxID=1076331 RepID=UPI001F4CAD94|nr:enoyl-CoA hydratase/isomerase family protein [Arsenicicoccus dermatophilus]MCH8613634.1 enoyl-CoA hydratase/isomerase family protein [Arsenicicoccus dermatophilus]
MSDQFDWWEQEFADLTVARREHGDRHTAVVTLDLPQRRNAMSEEMTASWGRLVELLRHDTRLACVVVTGAGSAFCSGGDLSWLVSEPDAAVADLRARMLAFYRTWLSMTTLEVPVVAAVNGHAVGAGLALALACDVRYVAETAKLSVPFTSLGLHPGMATTWALPRLVGEGAAADLLLTGRVVGGAEALSLGMASAAAPADEVLPLALAAADRIAGAAPVATRLTLMALRDGGHPSRDAALQWEALAQATTMATDDVHEGIAVAGERRAPRFTGR